MPINMSCPSCGKTLAAPDSAAGKKAKCPSCGQIMIVPGATQQAGDFVAPPPPPAAVPSGPQLSAGGESWLDEIGAASVAAGPGVPSPSGGERRPCPECGEMIVAGAAKCRFCGAVFDARLRTGATFGRFQYVPNYLAQAILVTLFCCLPFGIVSIVFASQVNGKAQAGDTRGAIDASNSAKTWCWASFGCGLAAAVLYMLFVCGSLAGHR